ncbi:MAG: hypothetical protein KNU04_gp18 [crAssphage sp. isolate ctbg_1]|uniref:Uncharacterized protein n=1 Tax=crAssphage sp. isolate ctbg_1 TaxID=2989854 RepID=A0A345MSZ0_9CAUD|nr:MAG: hypothetical protein KNU04_gp18 [crAssphage sp. isolate ctbg_1]AXH74490.1 MAG: hypothetical protein [crAssphage sp. isolate ctbg_1]
MDTNNTGVNATFSFNKEEVNNDKPVQTEVVEKSMAATVTYDEEEKRRLDAEYIDKRSVTIALVRNYSKYREANRGGLVKRVDYIGSCITSSRVLASNKAEVDSYFPQLIGISPNDPDYLRRVKIYLGNIQVKVDELGKSFDTSFRYNHYRDYLEIAKKEEAIENRYKSANRQNYKELCEALKRKIADINELESTKYRYGSPVNIEDYIIYRHCLLYNDIAKDIAMVNSDKNIRFYFKDDKKEADKLRKFRAEINKAKINYVSCMADEKLFEAIYIQYLVLNNRPITSSLLEDDITKQINLDKFSQSEPVKFNKFFKDENIKLKSMIEQLIARGIIVRSLYNQNITTADGTLIGANIQDAVVWFKNPENTGMVEAYKNQLKNI